MKKKRDQIRDELLKVGNLGSQLIDQTNYNSFTL